MKMLDIDYTHIHTHTHIHIHTHTHICVYSHLSISQNARDRNNVYMILSFLDKESRPYNMQLL